MSNHQDWHLGKHTEILLPVPPYFPITAGAMKTTTRDHTYWMDKAIAEARKAESKTEVPIGCVIVKEGKVIARAHNLRESAQDPAAHAELLAIRKAAKKLGAWRLLDCSLYVTLEPCLMCMGAIILARIPQVVFGCFDPKAGAAGSLYDLSNDPRLNHRCELISNVRGQECSNLLTSFFSELRSKRRSGQRQG